MSGSSVHPNNRFAAVGGPDGTGPWALATRTTAGAAIRHRVRRADRVRGPSMSTTPGSRPSSLAIVGWLVVALIGIAAAVVVVLNAPAVWRSFFPPDAKSVEGQQIRSLYDIVFGFAVVIFFVVEGLIVWSVIRYRRKPGDNDLPPQTHGNNLAEITWTLIPTIIVIVLDRKSVV